MDKKKLFAKEWFEFGETDLDLAHKLFEDNLEWDKWANIVCYHCEQGAEKFLKGFRILKGLPNKPIHCLDVLYKDCEQHTVIPSGITEEEVCDACTNLQSYAVHVRYPGYDKLEYEDIKSAIKDANIIRKFIMRNIEELIKELNK